ncbi:MAG: hypothetical protein ACRELD_08345 [Longimicrobiales bacterium]
MKAAIMRGASAAITGAMLAVSLTGCYTYIPVEPGSAPAGAEVRARITAAEAQRLANIRGSASRSLEATVESRNDGSLLLRVPVAERQSARTVEAIHQRIEVLDSEILELELRQLDRTRTAAVIAGGALALGAAAVIGFQGSEPGGEPPDGGTPPEARIPLWLPLAAFFGVRP